MYFVCLCFCFVVFVYVLFNFEVMADRAVNVRGNHSAEQAARTPNHDGYGQMVKVTIDGMDQSKFRCPRNLASSAEFASLWRPQLHIVGTIVWGHLEVFYVMHPDQAKDANMECTVISRTLDLLANKFEESSPGCALPRTMVVAADNTTREAKNQIFATYCASLVTAQRFDAVEVQYLQTGHTHNEQDQRFSSVSTLLSRAPILEDPSEFADWIRAHLQPVGGRQIHVEVLQGTFDFRSWYLPLNLSLLGYTSVVIVCCMVLSCVAFTYIMLYFIIVHLRSTLLNNTHAAHAGRSCSYVRTCIC